MTSRVHAPLWMLPPRLAQFVPPMLLLSHTSATLFRPAQTLLIRSGLLAPPSLSMLQAPGPAGLQPSPRRLILLPPLPSGLIGHQPHPRKLILHPLPGLTGTLFRALPPSLLTRNLLLHPSLLMTRRLPQYALPSPQRLLQFATM